MADKTPETAPVIDRRTPPRGVLPRAAQTWLMVGLAFGILAVIVFTGRPEPTLRPASRPASASTLNPNRFRDYEDYLRLLEERARQEAEEPSDPSPEPPGPPQTTSTPPRDPLAEEKRRRAYESLFAGIVVLTRQPEAQLRPLSRERTASTAPSPPMDAPDVPAAPSLDAIADAVLRASTRQTPATTTAQAPNQATGASPRAETSQDSEPTGPIADSGSLHRLPEGTVLETILKNRLDGSGAAPVDCLVTTPVYSHNRRHLVIPQGARVLGETKPVNTLNATRLAVTFHRLVLPNGQSYPLTHAAALNQTGDAHLHDQVNRHYTAMFGAAGAIGLITGLTQALSTGAFTGGSGDRTVIIAGGAGDAAGQASTQALNRFLNRQPTITIREGHRVLVYLTRDLDLPAYQAHPTPDSLAPPPHP